MRSPGAEAPEHVLVLRTLGAAQRRRLRRRRPRPAEPEPDPAPVPTSRATVIEADPLADADAARSWLRAGRGDEAEARLHAAVSVLNRPLAELEAYADGGDLAERLAELRAALAAGGEAANAALEGPLDADRAEEVARVTGRLEAALRAKAAAGAV